MGKRKTNIDVLSGLPDEILYHILSFLPTKSSVSTSVLAKRWRFLWTHVPNLQFDGYNFRVGRKSQNMCIINRVIMLHEAKIVNTFRLSNVKGCAFQLETLLIYPIKRGVRNLYLDYIVCTLPRLLLTCKTLVDLKLNNCGLIRSSGELFLPSLKKLNLSYVQYEDGASLPHLLSGCPVLEELTIDYRFRTEEKNPGCFIVSSPTIKKLNVKSSDGLAHCSDVMLIIDVPALKYLKMNRCHLDRVRSLRKTMTSLIEAEMMVNRDCGSTDFFSCLCHVRRLNILSYFGETLVDIVGTGSMPKFVHLTKLCIGYIVNWYNVVKFLEVADNLEDLSIILFKTTPYKEPKRVPTCLLSCLRTVTVCYLNPCEDSFDIVRYILRNAQVLERMEVFYSASDKEKFDAVPSISMIERVSKSCQVYFFKN